MGHCDTWAFSRCPSRRELTSPHASAMTMQPWAHVNNTTHETACVRLEVGRSLSGTMVHRACVVVQSNSRRCKVDTNLSRKCASAHKPSFLDNFKATFWNQENLRVATFSTYFSIYSAKMDRSKDNISQCLKFFETGNFTTSASLEHSPMSKSLPTWADPSVVRFHKKKKLQELYFHVHTQCCADRQSPDYKVN